MQKAYIPASGDVIWMRFGAYNAIGPAGRRPAFVVSPLAYNRAVGLALCCPVTSKIKGYPFEVVLEDGEGIRGAVLTDQIKSLDWRSRKASYIGRVPAKVLSEVRAKIATLV